MFKKLRESFLRFIYKKLIISVKLIKKSDSVDKIPTFMSMRILTSKGHIFLDFKCDKRNTSMIKSFIIIFNIPDSIDVKIKDIKELCAVIDMIFIKNIDFNILGSLFAGIYFDKLIEHAEEKGYDK